MLEEYTKLSVHNHFGGKDADLTLDRGVDEAASFDLAKGFEGLEKAGDAGFKLLAQTNSNHLDVAAYFLMRKKASYLGIELLPGVELNLLNWDDGSRVLHVVVVLDPASNLLEFEKQLRFCFGQNGRFFITIDQLCEALCDRRAVLCFHGLKQDDRGLSKNPGMAQEALSMNRYFPVAVEDNRAYHKLTLRHRIQDFLAGQTLEWFDTAADLSSADRQAFDKVPSPTYMWAGSTFDDFFYSVLVGGSRIVREEDIVSRVSYVSRVVIDNGESVRGSEISCSQGLNCIIGPSGSGKTLLLDILKMKLKGEHVKAGVSNVGDYEGLYVPADVHLYGRDGNEILASEGFEVIEGDNLYAKVIKAYSTDISELVSEMGLAVDGEGFTELVDSFKDDMNRYLRRMAEADDARSAAADALAQVKSAALFVAANDVRRTDTIAYNRAPGDDVAIAELSAKTKECTDGLEVAKKHFEGLLEIAAANGLSEGLRNRLVKLRNEYLAELVVRKAELESARFARQFEKDKKDLLFTAVQSYNQKVSGQYHQLNEKKQLIIDKLSLLAEKLVSAKKTDLSLEVPTLLEGDVRGSFGLVAESDIARLSIKEINLAVGDESAMKKLFPSHVRTRPSKGDQKAKVAGFSFPIELSSADSVKSMLSVFYDAGIKDGLVLSLPLSDVASYAIELKGEDGNYQPLETYSAGMLSKIYVSYFLDKAIQNAGSNTILLYDQPELNMEKEFLLKTLGDKLKELRKVHQIFVATHEPLLVVNADANEIILASNDKKVDAPNCIHYENRSFVGAHGRSDLIEGVARLIDGGTDAVKHRSGVYEGMIRR